MPFFTAQLEPLGPPKRYLAFAVRPRARENVPSSIGRAPGLVLDCRIRGFCCLPPRILQPLAADYQPAPFEGGDL